MPRTTQRAIYLDPDGSLSQQTISMLTSLANYGYPPMYFLASVAVASRLTPAEKARKNEWVKNHEFPRPPWLPDGPATLPIIAYLKDMGYKKKTIMRFLEIPDAYWPAYGAIAEANRLGKWRPKKGLRPCHAQITPRTTAGIRLRKNIAYRSNPRTWNILNFTRALDRLDALSAALRLCYQVYGSHGRIEPPKVSNNKTTRYFPRLLVDPSPLPEARKRKYS